MLYPLLSYSASLFLLLLKIDKGLRVIAAAGFMRPTRILAGCASVRTPRLPTYWYPVIVKPTVKIQFAEVSLDAGSEVRYQFWRSGRRATVVHGMGRCAACAPPPPPNRAPNSNDTCSKALVRRSVLPPSSPLPSTGLSRPRTYGVSIAV
ncbi:hypothetical protein C8R47DRAFT_1207037 [Mycena vitilis]|nr:hypothetical protein C8R47DRAFT_1207037 [Mycena vitilis]